MPRISAAIAFVLSAMSALTLNAQDVAAPTMDERINSFMEPITAAIMKVIFFTVTIPGGPEVPFVLIWLLLGALIFTVYYRFINVRAIRHTIDVVRGKFDDPNHKGEVSHFQALTAALSGLD